MTADNHLKRIPAEVLNGKCLNGWRLTEQGKKPPINVVTGRFASTSNPKDWHDIGTVFDRIVIRQKHREAIASSDKVDVDGIGRLSNYDQDHIFAIDLDNVVVNGVLTELAREHLFYGPSYTEYSPSGNGLRIFLCGELPEKLITGSVKKIFSKKTLAAYPDTELALYVRDSYVTITGNWLEGTPTTVLENEPYVEFLLDQLEIHHPNRGSIVSSANGTKSADSVTCTPSSYPVPNIETAITSSKTADQVIEEIKRSGKRTKELFLGLDGNSSDLEMTLCHKLVPFCDRDTLLMDTVIRKSPHFEKHDRHKKWDKVSGKTGLTYGEHTIKKALGANKWNGGAP